MAGDSKDVELRIRARDYSKKTLEELVDTLKELAESQQRQQEAAKRGEVSSKELEAAYRKLENVTKALISHHGLTKTFEAQSRALEEAKQRTEEARQAHQEYAKTLAGAEQVTKKQETALARLATKLKNAEEAQRKAEDRLAATTARLSQYGIGVSQIEAAQARIVSAVGEANKALERQERALENVEDDIRRAKEAAQNKALEEAAERERRAMEELRAALRASADEALAATKKYDELVNTLNEAQTASVAKTVRGIADPSGEAIRSMQGIDSAIAQVEARLKTADATVDNYRQSVTELANAQRSVANIATMLDSYRRQQAILEQAETNYRTAKEAVQGLAEQMKRGEGSAKDLGNAMSQAQSKLRTAANELRAQREAARNLEQALNEAGVATNDMAEAERRIVEMATRAARATERLAEVQRDADARRAAREQEELRAALNAAADEAIAAAKGYDTLANSITSIGAKSFAQQIREINDPAGEAIKSLEGVEKAVGDLEKRIDSIKGPIEGYRQMVQQLAASQKSLANLAGMIDAYRNQEAAVERAKEEYRAALTALRQLTDQMRQSGGSVSEYSQKLREAQARVKAAATEMRNQQQAAQNLRDALHNAGVSTRNLAESEERLVSAANRAAAATRNLTTAYEKYGVAVDKAEKFTWRMWFSGNTRQTLSWIERVRGELISLTMAYVGLQAAVNLAGDAIDAYKKKQAIEARLSILVGNDAKAIREEWDYLRAQADRLGFSFEVLAMDYSKFGIAARAAGITLQETRYIFEQMAMASRAANLSTDDFAGVMKALEQMLSKGTITAEELRQQLGDRLPGAFAMAARGAGMSIEEFTKAMEQGQISSEYVLNLARETGETYREAFDKATKGLNFAQGNLQSAIYDFKLALAENGFIDAYTQFIKELTALLKSPEGQQLAQGLSDLFTAAVNGLRWMAEHIEEVKIAFSAFIGLQVVKYFMGFVPIVTNVAKGVRTLFDDVSKLVGVFRKVPAILEAGGSKAKTVAGAMKTLGLAARGLIRFIPLVGWAWTAWEVYDWLSGKEEEAEKAGEKIGEAVADGIAKGIEGTGDPGTGGSQSERVRKSILKTLEKYEQDIAKMDKKARQSAAKNDLEDRLAIAAEEYEALKQQANAFITDEKKRTETLAKIEETLQKRLAVERLKFENEQNRNSESSAEKRRRIAEQVAMDLERIEADLVKRREMQDPTAPFESRLRARLDAIAHEYDTVLKRIREMEQFNKAGAQKARDKVNEYIAARQEVEALKVKQEELSRLESEMNRQISMRGALLDALQAQHEAGLMTQEKYREEVKRVNDESAVGIQKAAAELKAFAQTYEKLLEPSAYQELMARIEAVQAKNDANLLNRQVALQDAETDLNNLLAARQRALDEINTKYEAGLMTEREKAKAVDKVNEKYRDSITLAAQNVIAYAEAIRNPANSAAIDALIARMRQLTIETQYATGAYTQLDSTIVNSIANNGVNAFEQMASAMADVITGQAKMADGFRAIGEASAMFFAQLLRDIARAIIMQTILNALAGFSGGGGFMGAIGNAAVAAGGRPANTPQNHTGGIAGFGGNHTRRVDASWFAGAPRYHTGGLPGLQPNEVPAILQKGEEVLARDDPRHVLNGGGQSSSQRGVRFVLVDDRAKVAEAMRSAEGEEVVMLNIRRNIPTLKQMLGMG